MEELKNGSQVSPTQLSERIRSCRLHGVTQDFDASRVWSVDASETIEESGFAASRGTGKSEAFACADVEGDRLKNRSLVVAFVKLFGGKNNRGRVVGAEHGNRSKRARGLKLVCGSVDPDFERVLKSDPSVFEARREKDKNEQQAG